MSLGTWPGQPGNPTDIPLTEVNIMAIVKTIMSGTAVVHIDDSCCAGVSKEEMARRWAEVDRVIWQINQNHARRMAEAEAAKQALQTPAD